MTNKQIIHIILDEIRYWIANADLNNPDEQYMCYRRCTTLQCLIFKLDDCNCRHDKILTTILKNMIFRTTIR